MAIRLAAEYCEQYSSSYGNGLNGSSRTRILEIADFMRMMEAREDVESL